MVEIIGQTKVTKGSNDNALLIDMDGTGDYAAIKIENSSIRGGLEINNANAAAWGAYIRSYQGEDEYVILTRSNSAATNVFYRNLNNTLTAGPVVNIYNNNTGDDQIALSVRQEGDHLAGFFQRNNSLGVPAVQIINNYAGTLNNWCLDVRNDGVTGGATNLRSQFVNGGLGTSGSNLFYRNLASADTGGPVVYMTDANSGDDQNTLRIDNQGTGHAIRFVMGQDVELIDFNQVTDGGTSHTTIAGSVKVTMPNNTTGYINFYT